MKMKIYFLTCNLFFILEQNKKYKDILPFELMLMCAFVSKKILNCILMHDAFVRTRSTSSHIRSKRRYVTFKLRASHGHWSLFHARPWHRM